MNEFYSISEENKDPIDEFQLKNLGKRTVSMIVGKSSRRNFWEETESPQSTRYYTDVKSEDYDGVFAYKLKECKPPYDLGKILDYHLSYYINERQGDKSRFLNQIKFVILPKIKKYSDSDIYVELINDWLNANGMNKKDNKNLNLHIGDINAPTQFQMNSDNSHQTQQITYEKKEIIELLDLIKKDLDKISKESREDLENEIANAKKQLDKGKNINSRLKTIGSMIKDIGVGVFTNLATSPLLGLLN